MIHRTPYQALIAASLALNAGFADSATYLRWHIFCANMTGNTVLVGIAAAAGDRARLVSVFVPIVSFFGGCVLAQFALEQLPRFASFALEAMLIAFAAFIDHQALQIDAISIAMGVQNTTLTSFGDVKANTSFITGDYVSLAAATAAFLTGRGDPEKRNTIGIIVPLILAYAIGAAIAVVLLRLHFAHVLVLLVPLVIAIGIADHDINGKANAAGNSGPKPSSA